MYIAFDTIMAYQAALNFPRLKFSPVILRKATQESFDAMGRVWERRPLKWGLDPLAVQKCNRHDHVKCVQFCNHKTQLECDTW